MKICVNPNCRKEYFGYEASKYCYQCREIYLVLLGFDYSYGSKLTLSTDQSTGVYTPQSEPATTFLLEILITCKQMLRVKSVARIWAKMFK